METVDEWRRRKNREHEYYRWLALTKLRACDWMAYDRDPAKADRRWEEAHANLISFACAS